MPRKSPFPLLVLNLLLLALVTAFAPLERSLGSSVRVVYLHGVWVWASLAAFVVAGVAGLLGLARGNATLHRWSLALGRTGLLFWITYIPISMWAMQTNWNGLFLAEPRWRLALVFSISGLLLQLGLTFLDRPAWASAGNLAFIVVLLLALRSTENVMHPPSPILNSDAWRIQLYFTLMLALTLLAAWQVARWLYHSTDHPSLPLAD
jgi:hypothetical protein